METSTDACRSHNAILLFHCSRIRVARFPRSKDRGPIEAVLVECEVLGVEALPRLKNRGPIDAVQLNRNSANLST